jgi:lipoprotein-anchoring transpeptidase ErfK/SrfK
MLRVAKRLQRALALGLIAFSCPLAAAAAAQDPSAAVSAAPDALRPGQYRWHAEAAPAEGPVSILVSLPLQRAYVFRAGVAIGVSTVSSGQPGYDTPTGAFTILEKDVDHRSNLYEDAPMPFMLRLTWDGVALHAGQVAAEPASHGCVRLPRAFARRLYAITGIGTRVVVTDQAPSSPDEALALLTGGTAGTSIASTE